MGRSEKTTEFLKECMADALLKLLRNTPVEKITVDQIVKEAGVGRATWFRNFTGKYDAVTYKLVCLWDRWAQEQCLPERNRFSIDNVETFFAFFYHYRQLHTLICLHGMHTAMYDGFYKVMMPHFGADPGECYWARFYSYGLFGLVNEWIKREFCETPEEMARIFRHYLRTAG